MVEPVVLTSGFLRTTRQLVKCHKANCLSISIANFNDFDVTVKKGITMGTGEFLSSSVNAVKSFAEYKDVLEKEKIELAKIGDHNPKILERIRVFLRE